MAYSIDEYASDEQRSAATPVRPAPKGCDGTAPSPASFLLDVPVPLVRHRRRSLHLARWRSQRGHVLMTLEALKTIRTIAEPILAADSTELVELTCHRQGTQLAIRFLVDKVGGLTIHDCAKLNQRIGRALEESGALEESSTLEVSSPGLDRPLASKRDFERALGEPIELELNETAPKPRRVTGTLLAVQEHAVVVTTRLMGNVTIPLVQIQRARKAIQWSR